MRVVFFGTPEFSADVLNYLLLHQVQVVAVISKPDRPKGRSGVPMATPVKLVAQQAGLPLYQPELVSDPSLADTLKAYEADLFVVVAYGEIIKQHLLDMPHKACLNLHTSLLPKYRGAAPIQRAIIYGEKESGVTIMHMVKKMDAGDIIYQVKVPIASEMTFGELEEKLCKEGKKALLQVIHQFANTGNLPQTPQDITQVTLAPKIELEDCQISWSLPAQQIHDLVRGVNPYPGAWCWVRVKAEVKRLKISRTRVLDLAGSPGAILNKQTTKGNLIVATGDKALELLEVQLEGKKKMSSEELMRGLSRDEFFFEESLRSIH